MISLADKARFSTDLNRGSRTRFKSNLGLFLLQQEKARGERTIVCSLKELEPSDASHGIDPFGRLALMHLSQATETIVEKLPFESELNCSRDPQMEELVLRGILT